MTKYWALKTRRSQDDRRDMSDDKWKKFIDERVIAIGWEKIGVSPNKVNDAELKSAIRRAYHCSDRVATISARTIKKFVELNENDKILICQGFTSNEDDNKKVHLYGTAEKIGPFYDDSKYDWWRFKHKAKINKFGQTGKNIPKKLLANKLRKGSLLLTIQQITKEGYANIVEWAKL